MADPCDHASPQPPPEAPVIHLPASLCRDADAAVRREWLVTNGLGGFACGTVAGCLTRRYHGLLLAALTPPIGRTLLLAKLDETLRVGQRDFALYSNWWPGGLEHAAGFSLLRRFDLSAGVPTWCFEFAGCRLLKRIWMEPGQNTTYVQYELSRAPCAFELVCRALVNYRDYHALTRSDDWRMNIAAAADGLVVQAFDRAAPLHLRCPGGQWQADHTWYRDFHLAAEQERGFDHRENHLSAGTCRVTLEPHRRVTLVASVLPDADTDGDAALTRRWRDAHDRLNQWRSANHHAAPAAPLPIRQLVLAADQFIVVRGRQSEPPTQVGGRPSEPPTQVGGRGRVAAPPPHSRDGSASRDAPHPTGKTVIAGYPWFTDWGRDTMIALPGLTLVAGRRDVARDVLLTFARHVDQGMIPNRFPDRGEQPEYNAVDATLWFVWAVSQYVRATRDLAVLERLYPTLCEIVDWFTRGTRFSIHVDPADGLLYAGQPGVQLTWMDAKVGPHVITPRIGKPVEISALWYDALLNMASFAAALDRPADDYRIAARKTHAGSARFWNAPRGCCFDVLDTPQGDDATVRPNQIFAVSLPALPPGGFLPRPTGLPDCLLSAEKCAAVVSVCQQKLLTWFGLRSLAPDEPGYRPRYAGDGRARDEAYHQGTAWGWLLGPFVIAHYRVHWDAAAARRLLAPMLGHVWSHGVGSLSEISDADPPHAPNGCIAQAWSVAETLRAWQYISA